MCISDYTQTTFFYLERFLKKLADDQFSSITKGIIYHIKHYVHATCYHGNGLTWNLTFNGSRVSTMLNIHTYCVLRVTVAVDQWSHLKLRNYQILHSLGNAQRHRHFKCSHFLRFPKCPTFTIIDWCKNSSKLWYLLPTLWNDLGAFFVVIVQINQ